MGHFQDCAFSCRNKHIIISLALLLISTFTQKAFMAEGRSTLNEPEFFKEREVKMKGRALIGSRPPRCERRCSTCVHCQAVQVPIAPQQKKQLKSTTKTHSSAAGTSVILNSRGDDLTNYKPMSWKCKCGSFFFDP